MVSSQPHVSIIILNWNGWRDTIECLESVLKSDYENYHVLLVDNASTDGSKENIKQWALQGNHEAIQTAFPELVLPLLAKPLPLFELRLNGQAALNRAIQNDLPEKLPERSMILVHNHENMGFAAGNNLAFQIADILFQSRYLFLLNNDTVIEPHAAPELVSYLDQHPEFGAVTSAIYYYSNPGEIHNVGGRLSPWASSSYFTTLPGRQKRRITFVTGCALMIPKSTLERVGGFSEKFFFGEEDFEFCWRLLQKNIPVTCVLSSKVYHKVSVAADAMYQKKDLPKKLIYIFSRVVDMKDYYPYPVWLLWRYGLLAYTFFWLTIKYKVRLRDALRFVRYIRHYTRVFNELSKKNLETILREVSL